MNLLAELRARFSSALAPLTADPAPYLDMIRPSQDPRFGDFQANCAMPLAKERKANPRQVAAEIGAALEIADLCHETEIAGPGFINLRLRDDWLAEQANRLIGDERLGVVRTPAPRKIIVDFSSPNVAKPMHVGHLRSTVIGDALCRVLRFLGHEVTADNHLGDWGTQFGMIIYGYKHFRDDQAYARNPVGELARLYRLVNQLGDYHTALAELPRLQVQIEEKRSALSAAEAQSADPKDKDAAKALRKLKTELAELQETLESAGKKRAAVETDPVLSALAERHPQISEKARQETAKLHGGDAENRALWEQFLPQCLAAIQVMYDRLGVRFDTTLGESYFQPMLGDVVADLLARSTARESEGAVCVFIPGNDAPFLVRKSDGAFTYATTDLATIKYRAEQLGADEAVYVVDARQGEHFKLLFETARLWGYERPRCRHVSFGTILGDDKRPFKTRSGDTVGLESLIDESIARARTIVDANDDAKPSGPELDEAARADVARAVGIGSIKYADLRHNRESDYVFNWEKMLATNGDTATYMQYAYARICGIFRKGEIDRVDLRKTAGRIQLTTPEERALALQLVRFAEAVEEVVADNRPNLLTQYLFETANRFSTFYQHCPVLQEADEAIRTSRLLLCDLTARAMDRGLDLLGIETSPQM